MHRCLWNEPLQFSERVGFTEFEWEYHIFLNAKTGEWDPKVLLFNYWDDLVLGWVEIYFLEVARYVSLKRTTTVVWDGHFCWIWVKIPRFLGIKTGECDLKNLLFNYWNHLALGSLETYFMEVGAYVSLKRAKISVWECRLCWIWVEILHLFKYKNAELDLNILLFN